MLCVVCDRLLQQQQQQQQMQRALALQHAAAAPNTATVYQRGPALTLPLTVAATPNVFQPFPPPSSAVTAQQQLMREQALMGITVTGQKMTHAFQNAVGTPHTSPIATGSLVIVCRSPQLAPMSAAGSMADTAGAGAGDGVAASGGGGGAFPNADILISDLEYEFRIKPLHAIQLPCVDAKSFAPQFSLEPSVDKFYRPDEAV